MSTKTATAIENELNQTSVRLDELRTMRGEMTDTTDDLQTGFIEGTASLDALQSEQAKLTTLETSISALEAKERDLQNDLAATLQRESDNAALEAAAAIAVEVGAALGAYADLREELDQILRMRSEQMFDQLGKIRALQKNYKQTLEPVTSGSLRFSVAPDALTRFEAVKDDLRRKQMSDDVVKLATADLFSLPPVEFEWTFQALLNSVINKRETEARRIKRAAV